MLVRELIEKLEKLNPELEARIWDQGWGDHVPVCKLEVCVNHVILECNISSDDRDDESH